jgi:transposase-like protein
MARYTPEFLAALRHRYEQTHQSERSIARDFGLPNTTLRSIAMTRGWVRPPEPVRDLEPAMRLQLQAIALERGLANQRGEAGRLLADETMPARIPVARYTPALLTALRQRYEQTRQSARSIARHFSVSDRTLRRIAAQRGWTRPWQARRDLEPAQRLLEEATALERRVFGMK